MHPCITIALCYILHYWYHLPLTIRLLPRVANSEITLPLINKEHLIGRFSEPDCLHPYRHGEYAVCVKPFSKHLT